MKNKFHTRMMTSLTVIFLFLSQSSWAEVTIGLFLDKQTHIQGNTLPVISITAQNSGPVLAQDVHIGIISPSGTIYEFPNWNTALQPWLPGFAIPANFQLGNTVITGLNGIPGGLTPGIWRAYFALTTPGKIDINKLQLVGLNVIDNLGTGVAGNGSRFGSVSISRTKSKISGLTNEDVSASAGFYEANTSFPDLEGAIQGQNPAIDECIFNQFSSNPIINNNNGFAITSLDAGQLSVTGGGNTIAFEKNTSSSSFSYSAQASPDFFDNAANFSFSGTGGPGVGSFVTSVPSTKTLDLLSPSPNSSFNINPGQNFDLVWTNNNFGAGEVVASLIGTNIDFNNPTISTVSSITCRFIDDGQGTIPAILLTQLKQTLPANSGIDLPIDIPGFSGLSQLTLSVNRTNLQFFSTNVPSLTVGIATVSSGTFLSGDFQ